MTIQCVDIGVWHERHLAREATGSPQSLPDDRVTSSTAPGPSYHRDTAWHAHTGGDLRWLWLALLSAVLVGCGSHTPSADEVQQQFIVAIQHNDQPAQLRLIAPTALYTVADIPAIIYNTTVNPHTTLNSKPTGPFQRVEIQPATPRGAAMVSKSVWHYQAAVDCFDTTLAKFGDGWKVISIYRADICP